MNDDNSIEIVKSIIAKPPYLLGLRRFCAFARTHILHTEDRCSE